MQPTVQAHIAQQEAKQAESRALDTLLENSQSFQVALNLKALQHNKLKSLLSKLLPWVTNKLFPKHWDVQTQTDSKGQTTYLRTMYISPLYLGTIDQIRQLSLTINYNEQALQQDPIAESRRLFNYTNTMARIAAIATINAPVNTTKKYKKQLNGLTHFYKEHMTSTSLLQLIGLINFMSNPVDFTNSIRLVQMSGTTQPKANQVE